MTAPHAPARPAFTFERSLPFLVLLAAFALRAWQLADIPPGLTHDEAAHAHDAAHILKGITPIYFTVGSGREPLFDYVNAAWIAGLGASLFSLRLSAVVFAMIALSATGRAARMLFDRRTAWMAMALMAVSFWPLVSSRQILRSAMLPVEMLFAVVMFLKLSRERRDKSNWLLVMGLGVALAASLYTYIPARALWLMFPLAALAPYVFHWRGRAASGEAAAAAKPLIARLSLSLLIAGLLASPLFVYLYRNPQSEQRIGMLSAPLDALRGGDPSVLLHNARALALGLFLPGHGDSFLAYTIPGRPLFDPVMVVLFLIGLGMLGYRLVRADPSRLTDDVLLSAWLVLGLAPSLITGPEAMTTRLMGAQPVLYLLAALPLARLGTRLMATPCLHLDRGSLPRTDVLPSSFVAGCLVGAYLLVLGALTARDYFVVWGQSPDVRAAYQSTLVAMLKNEPAPAVVSTVYPAAPHDPYIGELFTTHDTRWIDARLALVIPPGAPHLLLAPSSTPPHPAFSDYVTPMRVIPVRETDLDPAYTAFDLGGLPEAPGLAARPSLSLNEAIGLIDSGWSAAAYRPGDVAESLTVWRVVDAGRLGLLHPPAFKTELNLFTHVLNPDGAIFLQQDRLDAPSWDWQTGDAVLQIHPFAIPPDAPPGAYPVIAGFYDRITGERLTTPEGADHVALEPLVIQP